METIVAHPENLKQLEALKAFMEEQNINFEIEYSPKLPESILESIERGLNQANNNLTISFDEFKSKHFRS